MSDTRGFQRSEIDASWYPRARKGRAGTPGGAEVQTVRAPRKRIFPWVLNVTPAGNRHSFSCPPCIAPAVIQKWSIAHGTAGDPPSITAEIGIAYSLVRENAVNRATSRPYTSLIELQDPFGYMTAGSGTGYPAASVVAHATVGEITLDIPVTGGEFRPVVAIVNASGGAASFNGFLTVLEGVDPEAIRFFL